MARRQLVNDIVSYQRSKKLSIRYQKAYDMTRNVSVETIIFMAAVCPVLENLNPAFGDYIDLIMKKQICVLDKLRRVHRKTRKFRRILRRIRNKTIIEFSA